MTKVKVFVKYVPIVENEYRYGVFNTYSPWGGNNLHSMMQYYPKEPFPHELTDVKYQGELHFGNKNERGVYFKTEELALQFAKLLLPFIQSEHKSKLLRDKAEKLAKKELGSSKLLHIIPETWLTKLRIMFNT